MKRFNSVTAKIRNSEGKFDTLPALRGATSYEVAVRNGFKGTEDDWLSMMIDEGWVGKYQELEAAKADKDKVYLKEDVDNKDAKLLSKLAPIQPYLTFVGNVNPDMVAAAFGKGNEDDILGVGKALAMYANFKEETVNTDYLIGYDKFSDIVKDHKLDLMNTPTVLELIKSSPYATNILNNTLAGLPDIVLYDAGATEYLDFANANVAVDYVDTSWQNDGVPYDSSVDTNGNISISKKAFTRQYGGSTTDTVEVFKYVIPLLKDLPDLTLYRTLHISLSDTEQSFVDGMRSSHTLKISMGGITNKIIEIDNLGDFNTETYFTGEEYAFNNSSQYASNPTSENVTVSIVMNAGYMTSSAAQFGTANFHIDKIWITEA